MKREISALKGLRVYGGAVVIALMAAWLAPSPAWSTMTGKLPDDVELLDFTFNTVPPDPTFVETSVLGYHISVATSPGPDAVAPIQFVLFVGSPEGIEETWRQKVIPEPGTAGLLALGLSGLAWCSRPRSHTNARA